VLSIAKSDFDTIIDFIAEDNLIATVSQGNKIERQISAFQQHPIKGRQGLVEGTRFVAI